MLARRQLGEGDLLPAGGSPPVLEAPHAIDVGQLARRGREAPALDSDGQVVLRRGDLHVAHGSVLSIGDDVGDAHLGWSVHRMPARQPGRRAEPEVAAPIHEHGGHAIAGQPVAAGQDLHHLIVVEHHAAAFCTEEQSAAGILRHGGHWERPRHHLIAQSVEQLPVIPVDAVAARADPHAVSAILEQAGDLVPHQRRGSG